MTRHIKEGEGWRLGWNPDAPIYRGLIAGQDWALELTEAEWQDFQRLADQLAATMQTMAAELMAEETLACELESDRIWLEAEGYPQAYSLHIMVLTGRRAEGTWPPEVVPELLQALKRLLVF